MSDIAVGRKDAGSGFSALTVALLLVVGILGFAGTLVLGAFAPDFDNGDHGGSNALSKSATGYAGLVELAQATGRAPWIIRDDNEWDTDDLLVITPERSTADMSGILKARGDRPTLIVLPKWMTIADPDHQGWVNVGGLLSVNEPIGVLAPATMLRVGRVRSFGRPLVPVGGAPGALAVAAPRPLQAIAAGQLEPLLTDDRGHVVLGRFPGSRRYILADPDLLSNHGIRDLPRARAALAMLDFLNTPDGGLVAFDVVVNGLGRGRSPLKLMFTPPFLALTIVIAVVLALVGWQALARFGAARPRERAIAFGKVALIDNTAALVSRAGREGALGGRYAAMIRDRARAAFGVPAHLRDAEADNYLDRLGGDVPFTALVAAAEGADRREEILGAARALHQWLWEKTR
ncbi:MAG: hypothetical protein P0Y64_05875 [Candidatus Sphingomonas colombiensis]|nr:hypothetical protein [Sphingomonas sp.]WEK44334.1 MAG: hypothetical protein P0Y64_05875 [Sphingomonas sp.]